VTTRLETAAGAVEIDFDRLAQVLQPAAHVPYAPPHVFPMSAPAFRKATERQRPPSTKPRLALYVHVPFCRYACNFCFYVKQVGADRAAMERYVRAVQAELAWVRPGTQLHQLFVGGGTPTALPADLLDELLGAAFARVSRDRESTHTIECSPETLTPDHLAVFRNHRVGRVSMGIQSLSDGVLARSNRGHSGGDALAALEKLIDAGHMVNIDLIYGLPGQSEASFREDFRSVAERGAHCVNAYNLRVNEWTPVVQLLRDDERLELQCLVRWRAVVERTAAELGYRQRHWQRFMRDGVDFELDLTCDSLFGAGVSARSFLNETVYRNHPALPTYLERVEAGRSPVEEVFEMGDQERRTYFITRTLGCGKRLNVQAYAEAFGCSFDDDYGHVCRQLVNAGLIERDGDQIAQTSTGRLVYDLVTLAFYPRELQRWLEERHRQAMARRGVDAAVV
jgi:oxygen-independent coproporphyrinogen III oxidase